MSKATVYRRFEITLFLFWSLKEVTITTVLLLLLCAFFFAKLVQSVWYNRVFWFYKGCQVFFEFRFNLQNFINFTFLKSKQKFLHFVFIFKRQEKHKVATTEKKQQFSVFLPTFLDLLISATVMMGTLDGAVSSSRVEFLSERKVPNRVDVFQENPKQSKVSSLHCIRL